MHVRHVVVGLALGHLSDQAVTRAMSLARSFGARLSVVHGAGVESGGLGAARRAFLAKHREAAGRAAREQARGKLELLVEDPVYAGQPLDEYLHVSPETGADALLAFAKAHGADLIVLGGHRHRALLDLGGTARAVLGRASVPVWVEPGEPTRFERILAPVDLSELSTTVLEAARELGTRFKVPVRVLHVFAPPDFAYDPLGGPVPEPADLVAELRASERESLRALVARFDWGPLPAEVEHAEGEPAHGIVARAAETDLTVLGTHGHTGLARLVLGSTAERVLRHARGPVLVLPAHAG